VYHDEIDRSWFLSLLDDVVRRFEWSVLAYCQMTNHYHLAVHTPEPTLSAGMQRLNRVHAQRFNWRHGVAGHLFERPFRCRQAVSDEDLKELVRYVVLNPVRAGMYDQPGEWPWSSYRAAAGHVPAPDFLDVRRLYDLFEQPGSDGRVRFVEFLAAGHGRRGHDQGPGPETPLEWSGRGRGDGRGLGSGGAERRRDQSAKRRTTMHALWPPKPNEFEHATSMSGASRASFGM
jgi:REP element-mobilizing transposase RayT